MRPQSRPDRPCYAHRKAPEAPHRSQEARANPLKTFKDLLRRLDEVQGVPFRELALAHGISWPEGSPPKALGGDFVEAVLGLTKNPIAAPDLTDLNLEVKTIPIDDDLHVQENTKITMLNFQDVYDQDWDRSTVYHKLRSVLFAPVVKYDKTRPDRWYVRSPFIWMPSEKVMAQLRQDYDAVRALIRAGTPENVSAAEPPAGQGVHLIANTAGRDSADITHYQTATAKLSVKRRAWFLRKSLTRPILDENIRYGRRVEQSPFTKRIEARERRIERLSDPG